MSLAPVIIRDPGVEHVTPSERVIYLAFIERLQRPSRTSPLRAVLRTARDLDVKRDRVLQVIRKVNSESLPL